MSHSLAADGSSALDAAERVVIDRDDDLDRMRFRCPNGHTSWSPTNSHLWCKACADAVQHGADIDAEHYELHDAKTGATVPWSAVEFV